MSKPTKKYSPLVIRFFLIALMAFMMPPSEASARSECDEVYIEMCVQSTGNCLDCDTFCSQAGENCVAREGFTWCEEDGSTCPVDPLPWPQEWIIFNACQCTTGVIE